MVDIIKELNWMWGAHIQLQSTMYDTVLSSVYLGMNCFQVFIGNPYSFNRRKFDREDITKAVNLADKYDIRVYSHAPYNYNLAGSIKSLCWSGNSTQDSQTMSSLSYLEYELSILANFKGGVVIHPGSNPDNKGCLNSIVKTINKINFPKGSMLLLENCAGEGTKVPKTLDELKYILDNVYNKDNVGVCLDTAHIQGSGIFDLSKISEIDRLFKEFDEKIGLTRLKLIHFNDSKALLGSKLDRHEVVGNGTIWKNNYNSVVYLLKKIKELGLYTIFEYNKDVLKSAYKLNDNIN